MNDAQRRREILVLELITLAAKAEGKTLTMRRLVRLACQSGAGFKVTEDEVHAVLMKSVQMIFLEPAECG